MAIARGGSEFRAIIVMPSDAPQVKVDGTRGEGAEIIFYDRRTESREAIAAESGETGATVVRTRRSNDRRRTGQSGLEIVEQWTITDEDHIPAAEGACLGHPLAVPELRSSSSSRKVGRHGAVRSSSARSCRSAADAPETFCDALQTLRVSPITLRFCAARGRDALSVSNPEVAEAVRFAWERHGLVVEPGGAVGACGAARGKIAPMEDTVVLLSGGNIDRALHARIIA